MKKNTKPQLANQGNQGFTLVELMIALVISSFIVMVLYFVHSYQQKSYDIQESVVVMQQNIRAGLDIMGRELRMAGFDHNMGTTHPSCGATGRPGILSVNPIQLDISADLDADGDCDGVSPGNPYQYESTSYFLYINAAGVKCLGRRDNNSAGAVQAVAENIDAIEFVYLDSFGAPTAVLADVRAVQISILARAAIQDTGFVTNMVYNGASGTPLDLDDINGIHTASNPNPPTDSFRRRLLITTIQCRNIGL